MNQLKVSAFDLEGTLLRPERPLSRGPHTPEDFYRFTTRLLWALVERQYHTVLVTRAEQHSSEAMVMETGIPLPPGVVKMSGVLGSEQSYFPDGTPGVLMCNGNKGMQLKGYMSDKFPEGCLLGVAVGDTPDEVIHLVDPLKQL